MALIVTWFGVTISVNTNFKYGVNKIIAALQLTIQNYL